MKAILAVLIMISSALAQASSAPQCYGDATVSEREPFILTVSGLSKFQVHLFTEELLTGDLLSVTHRYDLGDSFIYILAVETTSIDTMAVNQAVAQKIKQVITKFSIPAENSVLECNGFVSGNPRAGGSNGN